MDVSIIVPVLAPEPHLEACLAGIRAQRYSEGLIEVLLVEYGGGRSLEESASGNARVRRFAIDHASPYAARNLAASKSGGDILLFTEPRCVPEPDWVGAHVERFRDGRVTVSVGHVAPARETQSLAMFTSYEAVRDEWVFSSGSWRHLFGRPKNMAIARRRFETHGPFVEVLRGGDSTFVQRVAREIDCEEIALTPQAVVRNQGIEGLPSCLRERFRDSRAMRRHQSSHAAPIALSDRVDLLRRTAARRSYGPTQNATLLVLLGAGILAFRAGAWSAAFSRKIRS